jgi:hypothetical protein
MEEIEVEEFEHVKDLLPEGCLPIASIRIMAYVDPEGDNAYMMSWEGEVPISTFLGFLEMAKWERLQLQHEQQEEDE